VTSTSPTLSSAVALTRSPSAVTGLCKPGVSTNTSCESGRVNTPMIRCRVVWGLSDTMLILRPQIALTSDDLPTFGRPTNVTNPERNRVASVPARRAAALSVSSLTRSVCQARAMTRMINGIDELKTLVGEHLGYSPYVEITQEQVNTFADATGDHQWIHVDPERAKAGPFGGPIAHGYLTLSLGPMLSPQIFAVSGVAMGVNYGAGKIRFPSPVPVGSKLRLGVTLASVEDIAGGAQVTQEFVFEVEGAPKPSCVAEVIFRYYVCVTIGVRHQSLQQRASTSRGVRTR
jgi:acyl dehydratase